MCLFAHIVSEYTLFTNIIGMEVFDLEIICCFGTFQQFVLNLLHDNILAIEHNENITGSEVNCACLPLLGDIERVFRRTGQGFIIYSDMNPPGCRVSECPYHRLERSFPGFRIYCIHQHASCYLFNGQTAVFRFH